MVEPALVDRVERRVVELSQIEAADFGAERGPHRHELELQAPLTSTVDVVMTGLLMGSVIVSFAKTRRSR